MTVIGSVFPVLHGMLMVILIFYLISSLKVKAFFNNHEEFCKHFKYKLCIWIWFGPKNFFSGSIFKE